MDGEEGKLFVGGILRETAEEELKDYFQAFGEVKKAEIVRNSSTGESRGFGFVVFVDPAVAHVVALEKHNIHGRLVQVKKPMLREEQQEANWDPINGKTKKIFLGGLSPLATKDDCREYFEKFGAIKEVTIMYDNVTNRPRGFGFITFDTEEAADRVLNRKLFHKLHGKPIDVQRAVPKDLVASLPHRPSGFPSWWNAPSSGKLDELFSKFKYRSSLFDSIKIGPTRVAISREDKMGCSETISSSPKSGSLV